MTNYTFGEINDYTGFANGDKFDSDEEVRFYFTIDNIMGLFGETGELTQQTLNEMAEIVIKNRWWYND